MTDFESENLINNAPVAEQTVIGRMLNARRMIAGLAVTAGVLGGPAVFANRATADTTDGYSASANLDYTMSGEGFMTVNYTGVGSTDPADPNAVLTQESLNPGFGPDLIISNPDGVTADDEVAHGYDVTYTEDQLFEGMVNSVLTVTFTDPVTGETETGYGGGYVYPGQPIISTPATAKTYVNTPTVPFSVSPYNKDVNEGTINVLGVDPAHEPAHGTVSFNETDQTFVYTPDADSTKSDSFEYQEQDTSGYHTDGIVNVLIRKYNRPKLDVTSAQCDNPFASKPNGNLDVGIKNETPGTTIDYAIQVDASAADPNAKSQKEVDTSVAYGEEDTAKFAVPYGAYLVHVKDSLGTTYTKYKKVAECKMIDAKAKISHKVDYIQGRAAKVKISNKHATVASKMEAKVGHKLYHFKIAPGLAGYKFFHLKGHGTEKVTIFGQKKLHGSKFKKLDQYRFHL